MKELPIDILFQDFSDVKNYQNNKLDRKYNSRMGWTDVSLCLRGPVVEDLKAHFASRWNFIYHEKYSVRKDDRYHPLDFWPVKAGIIGHPYEQDEQAEAGAEADIPGQSQGFRDRMRQQFEAGRQELESRKNDMRGRMHHGQGQQYPEGPLGGVQVQLTRSCCKWSHGVALEHSICNAYIKTIRESKHFVYM